MSEEELETKATTLVASIILIILLVGCVGFLVGERVSRAKTPHVDKKEPDACHIDHAVCTGRLAELERIFRIAPADLPPVPVFTKMKKVVVPPEVAKTP